MNSATIDANGVTRYEILDLEDTVRQRLNGRVSGFRLLVRGNGLILLGFTSTYHAKQLAQHAVMQGTQLPILANEIEVDLDDDSP